MSIAVPDAKLIEEAELQVNEADHDARTLRMLDEAERAAETSFRAGTVGFESQMRTLLFVAQRLVKSTEAQP